MAAQPICQGSTWFFTILNMCKLVNNGSCDQEPFQTVFFSSQSPWPFQHDMLVHSWFGVWQAKESVKMVAQTQNMSNPSWWSSGRAEQPNIEVFVETPKWKPYRFQSYCLTENRQEKHRPA